MILLIDGSSVLTAAYYATLPHELVMEKDETRKEAMYDKIRKSPDGRYINGIASFMRTLKSLVSRQHPSCVLIAFDESRKTTFRKRLYPDYKGQRGSTPEPLRQQRKVLMEGLKSFGFAVVSSPEYEADDLIASAAKAWKSTGSIRLFSRDQDYFQLVDRENDVLLWMPMSDEKLEKLHKQFGYQKDVPYKSFEFTDTSVEWWYGAKPSLVPDLKGITGDSSDNIPGVKGVSSAAAPLLKKYGSLEGIYDAIDDFNDEEYTRTEWEKKLADDWKALGIKRNPIKALKAGRNDAFLCRYLAQMRTDCPLDVALQDADLRRVDGMNMLAWCRELGFLEDMYPKEQR